MEDFYLKYYFYKILGYNNYEDRDKFFYVAKTSDISKIKHRLIHILTYYKSFVNRELTIKYIDVLNREEIIYLEEILNYILDKPYCKIVRYANKSLNDTDIDMKYTGTREHVYSNKFYSDEQLMNGVKRKESLQLEKYQLEDEFLPDKYIKYRDAYLDRTIYRSYVM